MAKLKVLHRESAEVHEIDVAGWDPVPVEDEGGTVQVEATGGNVLLRFGSAGPDFDEEVAVHEGETRTVDLVPPVFARAFEDRPVGDF